MQHGTWEASRLRVRVTSLAAENDALRLHVRQLLQEISSQQASSEAQHSVASKKSQLVESEAAGRVAELEEQMDRQRRALSELAVAAEDLASENVGLSTELVQLRTDKQTNSKALTELQSRTQTLQELYMRDLDAAARSPGTPTVREVQQQQALAALATPTLLAVSQPDQEPVGVGQWSLGPSGLGHSTQPSPGASNHNLVYQEREALQHSCSQLQAQVSKLEGRLSQVQIEKDEVSQQCAAERRRAVAAESQGQQRLVGALRRLDYLAAQHKEAEAVLQQRDRYITRLEGRLLANRRAAAANRTEASPLHGSLTNSSSTPQMVHDLGDLHALAASRAQNATAHGQAISGTPIRAQPSIRDSNASADGPQSSGSSRSLSIDDLERRIEALNSTLQLHVGQRAPLAGLQSPATPTGPLQPVDAPA
ncbi:hypothetical protein WJX84_010788 [Apatococcus fuscideae]|uniref:Uncharacterized protein n=1 Tax=Apatococcus fuscideae TaxID=2026836 RepID=A0AAW1TCZ5_9CHLO